MTDYKRAIQEGLELVEGIEDVQIRAAAFAVIFQRLLGPAAPMPASPVVKATQAEGPAHSAKPRHHKNKTGLTDQDAATLYQVSGTTLTLKVQPTGASVPDMQRMLACAILVGYYGMLGEESVSATAMSAAARDWQLSDAHLSTNIRVSEYIQARGVRKGLSYSLRPGAAAKLKDGLQKMARGEA